MSEKTTSGGTPYREVHIDRAAVVTARMSTPDEWARGYRRGPVLVVTAGPPPDRVYPAGVSVAFDDPHAKPEPDAVRAAARYVLDTIGEDLGNVIADFGELAAAVDGPPCDIEHLADRVRRRRAAEFTCADGICQLHPPDPGAT